MPQTTSKIVQFSITAQSKEYYSNGSAKPKFNKWKPSGKLITTLYEHSHDHLPVTSLCVTDDSQYFITASRLNATIKVWKTRDIESDVTSHSAVTIKVSDRQINQITAIDNSNYIAVAKSYGYLDIYSLSRADSDKGDFVDIGTDENVPVKSIFNKDEGDIVLCENMILPISSQHLLTYVSQRGSLFMHDMRARHNVSSEKELFGC